MREGVVCLCQLRAGAERLGQFQRVGGLPGVGSAAQPPQISGKPEQRIRFPFGVARLVPQRYGG